MAELLPVIASYVGFDRSKSAFVLIPDGMTPPRVLTFAEGEWEGKFRGVSTGVDPDYYLTADFDRHEVAARRAAAWWAGFLPCDRVAAKQIVEDCETPEALVARIEYALEGQVLVIPCG